MHRILPYTVLPALPERLEPLRRIAYNLWWAWHPETRVLFKRVDPDIWAETNHNPIALLGRVSQTRLEHLLHDEGFLDHLDMVAKSLDDYLADETWFARRYPEHRDLKIAYFSFEFGLTESLRIYSGGLGVLSGDHLKSASDLGLPLVGVGLFYAEGYFRQYLNSDGWQQETASVNDPVQLPLVLEKRPDGQPLLIHVDLPEGRVHAQVWRAQVGRVRLYLLDANVPDNAPELRAITYQLYGGDQTMRIRQEVLLGVGGMHALHAIGHVPDICHMNEGHSAFLSLERIRRLVTEQNLDFQVAAELVAASNVFTTHTPVPAGNDRFPPDLVVRHFEGWMHTVGLDRKDFIALGREEPQNEAETFCMTVLALKTANHSNAVSRLHADVSSRMWQRIWPEIPAPEIPIFPVTNGVHLESFVSSDIARIYDRYLGPRWREQPYERSIWQRLAQIPDEELWAAHERRRARLVTVARHHLADSLVRRGGGPREVELAHHVLNPNALTIGFARRFATYKRATLLLRDVDRLIALVKNPSRPVQLLFAGKAHPHDHQGKALIRDIIHTIFDAGLRAHVVFLEDYDLHIARRLVQGVDVWLNTPRVPLEASGTSGMKAVANGVLHCSTLDGWWAEAYQSDLGFVIGRGEEYEDPAHGDDVEAKDLYNLLEQTIVPLFYDRTPMGLPRMWIQMVKRSISELVPFFNTHRMLVDYLEQGYLPAARKYRALATDNARGARELAAWKRRVAQAWPQLAIAAMRAERDAVHVGQGLSVHAEVDLGSLTTDDVCVEAWAGPLDAQGDVLVGQAYPMTLVEGSASGGRARYTATLPTDASGRQGFTVRVFPSHPALSHKTEMSLVRWA